MSFRNTLYTETIKIDQDMTAAMALVVDDGTNDDLSAYYPVVQYGRLQFTVPSASFKSKISVPMPISLHDFSTFIHLKSNPSRAAEKWRPFINMKNLCEVSVDEGSFVYASFDVEGHPLMKYRLLPVPAEVALKLFRGIHSEVLADPAAYKLDLDAALESRRLRHRARLAVLEWLPSKCIKRDTCRPGVPSPREQSAGWKQVPPARFVPSCLKEIDHTNADPSSSAASVSGGGPDRRAPKPRGRPTPYPPWLSVREVNDGLIEKEIALRLPGDVHVQHDRNRGVLFVRHLAPIASVSVSAPSSNMETTSIAETVALTHNDDDDDGNGESGVD